MYLAILLIVIALIVFYNEVNSKMNVAEYALLFISIIAIIRASINYINIDVVTEGFKNSSSNNNSQRHNIKKKKLKSQPINNITTDGTVILNSEDSDEYLDTDDSNKNDFMNTNNIDNINNIDNLKQRNKIDYDAVNEFNKLVGIDQNNNSSKSNFENTPTDSNEINSSFNPQVVINGGGSGGSGGSGSNTFNYGFGSTYNDRNNSWNSAFNDDGFKFNNTMAPNKNLWRNEHGYYQGGDNCNSTNKDSSSTDWTQSMDDYNKGKWNRNLYNKPSDYVDYYMPDLYGSTTPSTRSESFNNTPTAPSPTVLNSYGQPQKLCGAYDDLNNMGSDMVISNYTQAKKWYPGYTYVPPVHWDVPQKHKSICSSANPNTKLLGIVDRGLPVNVLELNPEGEIADTESSVSLSNVGSMIPRFSYQEQPFSKPYV
jgi:hypothetical protein